MLLVGGCAPWRPVAPVLPDREDLRLDQLVIHCNFDLPNQHRLLQELNTQRTDVSTKLNLPISDEPVHVYLFADSDRFNEFMRHKFPQFPIRRAFFVESDTKLIVYAHWGDRVAEDLRHEVAHGYMHSIVQNLPLWLDEGLAEYFEVPRGQRGLNRPHVDELSAMHAAVRWQPDMQRLEAIKSPADLTQADYAESWAWVHWMLESSPARREILWNYLAQLRKDGTAPPLSVMVRSLDEDPRQGVIDHVMSLRQVSE